MAKEKKDLRIFASKIEARALKRIGEDSGKKDLRNDLEMMIYESLKEFLNNQGINGAEVILGEMRHHPIQPKVDEYNTRQVKESLKKF